MHFHAAGGGNGDGWVGGGGVEGENNAFSSCGWQTRLFVMHGKEMRTIMHS